MLQVENLQKKSMYNNYMMFEVFELSKNASFFLLFFIGIFPFEYSFCYK